MSQEDATSNGAEAERLRRPALERSEPRRGWGNLYAPGKADAARSQPPTDPPDADTAPAVPAAPPASARQAAVPLHPQERPGYVPGGARVLKLKSVAPGEWLADLEIDGKVRRVQLRAVDGEL